MHLFGAFRMCFLASYSACTQPFRLIALLSFTDSGNKMKRVRDKGAYLGRAVVNKERCGKRVKKRYSRFL